MNNDSYFTIFIGILIVIHLLFKTRIYVRNQSVILHFAILLFIVFLFYMKYEKSAFMTSLLYLIVYTKSYKIKEFFASDENLPKHSLNKTMNPTDKIAESILVNNNLPSQITSWFTGDSFNSVSPNTTDTQWRDLASNNHILFTSTGVKLNSSTTNNTSGPKKWVSGDITTSLSIPLFATPNDSVTFIHLTRYSPRTINRGKMWSNENGMWVSGYNDNKITVTNTDGVDISNGGGKRGDIMNIRGSNWNIFIDQMNTSTKTRTVNVNGNDYMFIKELMGDIPTKIGLNLSSSTVDKSDWECAEIMIYPRILNANELDQITAYFNKKYSMKYPEKIEENKYNIYNHYTFSSITDGDWQSPPQVGSVTQSGDKLLGITDSEYECVSLCDKNTTSCNAFSYHMQRGTCYAVDGKNILNHTTPAKEILSGTNRMSEDSARRAKEEAERLAREEAERQRLAAIEAERQRQVAAAAEAERQRIAAAAEAERQRLVAAAAEAERQRLAAEAEAERQRQAVAEAQRVEQQKLLLSQDRFIPIFDRNNYKAMGSDGEYKVIFRNGSFFPCYNMSTSGYINGGHYGSVLDNDDTTGVDIEKCYSYDGCDLPYKIVITLPVEKTFQGTFSMRLITPWTSKLPKHVSLATYNSNAFSVDNWSMYKSTDDNYYKLEEIDLGDVGGWGNGPYDHSFNVNFTRPFKHIALLIHSGWTQDGYTYGQAGAIWITSLNFMNIGSGPGYGSKDGTKKSFMCPANNYISGYFGRSGGWMDQIQFMCSDGTYSEKYGGDGGGPNIGYSWGYPTNGFKLSSAWENGPLSTIGLLTNPDTEVMFEQGGQLRANPGKINCPPGKKVIGVDVNSDYYVQKITLKCEK